jgi:hypothetical protein
MSLKDNCYGEAQGSGDERSADASQRILLSEYTVLLRTIEPVRIINRSLLIGLALLQFSYSPAPLSKQVLLQIANALACGFWFLQEFVTGKKLGRLGALIAATNADTMTAAKGRDMRPVVLPPPKKESQTLQTPSPSSDSPTSDKESFGSETPSTSFAQSWTNSYISWRQEAWKIRKFLILQRSEPILWFVLILAVEVYRSLTFR